MLNHIPIVRYKCKAPPKGKHRTFSLLPDNLIPYNRFTIDLLIYILILFIFKNQTTNDTLNQIDSISPDSCLISEKVLHLFLTLLEQTRIKLIHFFQQFPEKNKAPPNFNSFTTKDALQYLINYPQSKTNPQHCGAYYLCGYYYKMNGSYQRNARFLFGTASQFCIKPLK